MNKGLTPLLLLLVAGLACGMRKVYLGNNTTAVPKNTKAYKNRIRFDSSVLKDIDTSMVYEEIGYLHLDSLYIRIKAQYTSHYIYYRVLRFYSNGFMNEFIVDSTKPLTPKIFDPAYSGYRGVYYRKKSHIQLELLGPVNGLQHMGKLIYYIETKGDTLILSQGR